MSVAFRRALVDGEGMVNEMEVVVELVKV